MNYKKTKLKFEIICLVIMFCGVFGLAKNSSAWMADTCILGPGDGASDQPPVGSDDLSTNGQDRATQWKAFRWKANASGDAYVFSVRMQSVTSDATNVNTAYAIYDDNAGTIGTLKVWGYENGRNYYADAGCGGVALRKCFDMQNVTTSRTIVAGNYYWIAFRSNLGIFAETGSTSYFERAGGSSEPHAAWLSKCIGSQTADPDDMSETPYTAASYSCGEPGIADNYYGWAIWDVDIEPDVTSPAAPTGLSVQ
jgi:hypothetical protein